MFAISFDLVVKQTEMSHPRGVALANLFQAIIALKGLPWFASSVRDIRAFKVEHWSDFTGVIKSQS